MGFKILYRENRIFSHKEELMIYSTTWMYLKKFLPTKTGRYPVPLPWLSLGTLSLAPGETLPQSEQVLARPYCPDLKGGLPLRKPLIPGCCWGCLSHRRGLGPLPPRCLMGWFLRKDLPAPPLAPPGWDPAQAKCGEEPFSMGRVASSMLVPASYRHSCTPSRVDFVFLAV